MKFGVEIEMCGITRRKLGKVLTKALGVDRSQSEELCIIPDAQGRKWKVLQDCSIHADNCDEQCELVTPILTEADIPTLLKVASALKEAGAHSRAKDICGIHIHVDGAPHTPRSLKNLCKIIKAHEEQLITAFQVSPERINKYCKKFTAEWIKCLTSEPDERIEYVWYKDYPDCSRDIHYHPSRYHMLNLHPYFHGIGTVEFRFFQFTDDIDTVELEAMIRLALAMNKMALTVKTVSAKPQQTENPAYAFRTWLLRLGFIGEEFKAIRKFLMKNFKGNSAWRQVA